MGVNYGVGGAVPVFEAVEWREPAPGGGTQAQVFRLADGRYAVVKFPENPQGEHVLANEFMSCRLAERLELPVNRAILVSIDERLLRLPRQNSQIPPAFSAGVRCGMIRFELAEGCQPADIIAYCDNSAELHGLLVFEQLVCRQDGQQLLMYPDHGQKGKCFGACDYGYAFGGQPQWSAATLAGMLAPSLPSSDPFAGHVYNDGTGQVLVIDRLRALTAAEVVETLMELHPPRWGATEDDVRALAAVLNDRAKSLVAQFDDRHPKQLEVF